jgi:hypothetical protein
MEIVLQNMQGRPAAEQLPRTVVTILPEKETIV